MNWRPHLLLALALASPPVAGAAPKETAEPALELARKIDQHIADGWKKARVQPAPLSDDAEFLRRVYLDLSGRIPSVAEARAFLADKSPDKRIKLIDKLLASSRHVNHYTTLWRTWLMPEASTSFQASFLAPAFEGWIRRRLADNVGYDRMVRELLTTPIGTGNPFYTMPTGGREVPPIAFYLGKDLLPENIAGATSRMFLGIRLECAQCHDHPFASWKKEDFWTYAAFFSGLRRRLIADFPAPAAEVPDSKTIKIPGGTEKVVEARFLDGSKPVWKNGVPTRAVLADWLTSPKNPYFARALVNRMWEHFFGTGLAEPVDEMVGADNTVVSHPELLNELAQAFIASKYDLKFLIRAIVNSKTYQLTSRHAASKPDEPSHFARARLRGLTGEQLYDSVLQATSYRDRSGDDMMAFFPGTGTRQEFITKFNPTAGTKSIESQTSILQALSMMNGKIISASTNLEKSETLAAIVDAPFMTLADKIETLYLATLSRKPTAKELARMVKYVETDFARSTGNPKNLTREALEPLALADVFWALLNSAEFKLNH